MPISLERFYQVRIHIVTHVRFNQEDWIEGVFSSREAAVNCKRRRQRRNPNAILYVRSYEVRGIR